MRKAWNAFNSSEQTPVTQSYGTSRSSYSSGSPSRTSTRSYNDRSIITSICTRISIDVSDAILRHVKLDDLDRYLEDVDSNLNSCFVWEANLDQSPRAFRQDIAQTVLDRGVAAIVPVDTTVNPDTKEVFDIYSLRVGTICQWYPEHVRVDVWNEKVGKRQEITLPKRYLGIIENPLYAVMNETNSTFQRLSRKLTLLDAVDEQASSGKLDIIIQLPYVVKSDARKQQAEERRTDIEMQLRGSQYGIAYIDGTEKVVQLNRAAENNLLKTIEYLTTMLYGQLGITEEVMNGTADEAAMLNYMNRTIKPLVDAIVEGMQRAFIGPVGKRNNERIMYFIDPFKLVAMKDIAEIGDKLSRNEVVTSNELRGFIGLRPSADPKADELVNANMPQPGVNVNVGATANEGGDLANSALDELESTIDDIFKDLGGEPPDG
jgi:hypothetical protein